MKMLISGASGLVGAGLIERAPAEGWEITRLVRRAPRQNGEVEWDPAAGRIDTDGLEGHDAVVHLAGKNVAGLWTRAHRDAVRASRVEGTRVLASALAQLSAPPRVLVSASAVGYYGSRGDILLDESGPPGQGFLADVCREWEAATEPAARAGIRVVHLRIGVVLHRDGGALASMLPVFRLGVAGRLGDGRQYISWIARDDLVGAILFLIGRDDVSGPVNACSPQPVTNAEFTRTLAAVLKRPAVLPAPAFALKLALGEMADEMLLSSIRAVPAKLQAAGFVFAYPELEHALRHVVGFKRA